MSRTQTTNYQADPVGAVGGSTVFEWASSGDDYFSRTKDLANLALALERHTHAADRGLAVQRVAPGSINTDAIVLNPVFPGTVTVVGGFNVTTGNAIFSHNVQISGTLSVAGATTISSGSSLTMTGGAIVGAGNLAGTGLTLSAPGNASIPGTITVGGASGFTGAMTINGDVTVTNGHSVGVTGAVGAGTGLATIAGGITVQAGNAIFGSPGVSNMSVNGTIVSAGNITINAGGLTVTGTTNLNNNLTVLGSTGFLGNVGFRATITPESGFTPDLGASSLHWGTTYTNDLRVYNTVQVSGQTDLANTTVNGTLGVIGIAGFTSHIQPAANLGAQDCGRPTLRWGTVYAINGTIQTSSIDVKEHLTPLDTKLALRVALETKLHEFQYRTPDGEGGLKSLKTAKPRRERQVGFMAEDSHPMLLVAEDGVNGQNTASVALGAIQELAAQVAALTARLENLEGPKH